MKLDQFHQPGATQYQQPREPFKILLVCAEPNDVACIRLGEETREIKTWIKSGPFRDLFSVVDIFATRPKDLLAALLEHKPHIVHFSSHGSEAGIILEDNSGKASLFEFEQLAELLAAVQDNLRLLILNACHSAVKADALCRIVDCVIGMNHKILDRSAIDFATAFYLSLSFNRSIQECFHSAISFLPTTRLPQAHIPALLFKNTVDPSRIYPLSWLALPPAREELPGEATKDISVSDRQGTIQLEIILLPQGTNRARSWRYVCNQEQEFFEGLDEQKERLTPELLWQLIAAETNKPDKSFRNSAIEVPDVFLMLRDNLILNLYPEGIVENVVNQLCKATLGTNLYLVCDQEVPFNLLYQKKYETVLDRWFQTLVTSGVTDIIELPKTYKSTASEVETLRKCANKSRERGQGLCRLVSVDDWVLELRPEAKSLKRFLQRFTEGDLSRTSGNNLAVFYDQKPKFGWSELLKNSRERNCSGKWFVGVHAGVKTDSDLKEMWIQESDRESPERYDGVFEFQGMFEWLYAICRLHRAVRLARLTSPNVAARAMF